MKIQRTKYSQKNLKQKYTFGSLKRPELRRTIKLQ